jgi:hypothetical protein
MRLLSALFLLYSFASAEVVYPGASFIAHIVDGGGIQMELTITNLDDSAATYLLLYFDDNGNPLALVSSVGTGSEFSESLAPHASRDIRTAGTANTPAQGWAEIITTSTVGTSGGLGVGASVLFRFSGGPWAGSEVIVPADSARNNRFSLAFDHTASAVTGLAMVNPLIDPIAVTVTFRAEDGGIIVTDTFNMGGRTHRAIVTTSSYASTANRRGTIEISTTGFHLGILALRFGSSTVSSVVPLVSSAWSDIDNGCPGCWDY